MSVEIDDRITCLMCTHSERFRCAKLGTGILVDLPRRCVHFVPNPEEGDQRTGQQRWPRLEHSITRARAEEAEYRSARR